MYLRRNVSLVSFIASIKKMIPKNQILLKYIVTIGFILFFTLYIGVAITTGQASTPNNPLIDTVEESSKVPLKEGTEKSADATDMDNEKREEKLEEPGQSEEEKDIVEPDELVGQTDREPEEQMDQEEDGPEEPEEPKDQEENDPQEPEESTGQEEDDPEEPEEPTDQEENKPEEPEEPTDQEENKPEEPEEPTDKDEDNPEEPEEPTDEDEDNPEEPE